MPEVDFCEKPVGVLQVMRLPAQLSILQIWCTLPDN